MARALALVMLSIEQHGAVFLFKMDSGENRFNETSISALHAALDSVEAIEGPLALVTTGAGKFYSNGLDLDWVMSAGAAAGPFIEEVHRLLIRILEFPAITVAAVNGHAFAGGAMLASSHDFLFMREDRGYWCLPEVDLGLPLTETMFRAVAAHLPSTTVHEAALTGRRYDGEQMLAAGIAYRLVGEADLLNEAIAFAADLAAKDRNVIVEHKRLLRTR